MQHLYYITYICDYSECTIETILLMGNELFEMKPLFNTLYCW